MCAIRIEVLEGAEVIEVMMFYRNPGCNVTHKCTDVADAILLVKQYLKNDYELARRERHVPQVVKEGRKAFKEIEGRSPFKPTTTKRR